MTVETTNAPEGALVSRLLRPTNRLSHRLSPTVDDDVDKLRPGLSPGQTPVAGAPLACRNEPRPRPSLVTCLVVVRPYVAGHDGGVSPQPGNGARRGKTGCRPNATRSVALEKPRSTDVVGHIEKPFPKQPKRRAGDSPGCALALPGLVGALVVWVVRKVWSGLGE